MSVEKELFGKTPEGEEVSCFTINAGALRAQLLDWGGVLRSLQVPDRSGTPLDIVLGFDDLEAYLKNPPHFGGIIGRCANRIGGASFSIGDRSYSLEANNHGNTLHGGSHSFDTRRWEVGEQDDHSVRLVLKSPDGDQGFPGNLELSVTYSLTEEGLSISYEGRADQDTILNPTNHSYFNLHGENSGKQVLDHLVRFNASSYTPVGDEKAIPTGEIAPVFGTPMDFTEAIPIGERIDEDFPQLRYTGGYDHNYVLKREASDELLQIGEVSCEATGIRMSVRTDSVGFQFYTANGLDSPGKGGRHYGRREAFCIETQFFPDAANCPAFPSPLLKAGEVFRSGTVYLFERI